MVNLNQLYVDGAFVPMNSSLTISMQFICNAHCRGFACGR